MNPKVAFLTLPLALLVSPLQAADDRAAGLFAEATQLPLESQTLFVGVSGDEANVRLVQVFRNLGPAVAQADLILPLPEGASVMGFGFYQGERFLEASLKEKGEAEAQHRAAADAGRSTGLLVSEGRVQRFSVYPVPAGQEVRTEVRLRLPVVAELGRRHLALPIRSFLGRERVRSAVLLSIAGAEVVEELRISPESKLEVIPSNGAHTFAFSTREETEISWREPGPPLVLSASAIALKEGGFALETRVAFNRAPPRSIPGPSERHLIIDASRSMKRRERAVSLVIDRLRKLDPGTSLHVHAVAERHQEVGAKVSALRSASVGFRLQRERLATTLAEIDCHRRERDCLYLGDLTSEGLELLAEREIPMVLFADAYEARFFKDRTPRAAALYVEGADAEAKLLSQVDELVLPVLTVVAESAASGVYESKGRGARRVAEGGFLRLHARVEQLAALELQYTLEEALFHRRLEPVLLPEESPEALRLRRAYYERHLETALDRYEVSPSEDAKRAIIELSLREQIPTPFTALQVDGPRTSLFDVKPGDPLLSVADEPGLDEVIAFFPFGEVMALVRSDEGRFLGRFLVPRGYPDRIYAIEIAKHFEDGRTKWERAYYRIDSQAPSFGLALDSATSELQVDAGGDTPHIAAVWAEGPSGRVHPFVRSGSRFVHPAEALSARFRVHVRDRAGNLAVVKAELRPNRQLVVEAEPTTPTVARVDRPAPRVDALSLAGAKATDLSLEGRELAIILDGRARRFAYDGRTIRSLRVNATLSLGGEVFLIGTDAGDLVELDCGVPGATCRATRRADFHPQPIVGMASAGTHRRFVSVRDRGLFELSADRSRLSPKPLPTKRLTGLSAHGGQLYLGTADRGLLIHRAGTWQRSRLGARRIFGLRRDGAELIAMTETGDHRVAGKDRFEAIAGGVGEFDRESPALTSGAVLNGRLYVGGFDAGLFTLEAGVLLRVPMQAPVVSRHINRLLSVDGALIIASESGVARATPEPDGRWRVETLLHGPAHDLSVHGDRLAIAAAGGLFVGTANRLERWDVEVGGRAPRYSSVAWHQGALYAGGLDGLHRYEGPARSRAIGGDGGLRSTWITALCSTDRGLYVGTYDEGVARYDGLRLARIEGLETQWVPFGAIRALGGKLYVGGLGMNPAIIGADGEISTLAVPSRDVNDFVVHAGRMHILTRDGLGILGADPRMARAR